LVQAHILREIDAGKECKYYALCLGTKNFQAQIICDDCNKICEMDAPFMSWYSESAAKKLNMEALSARLQITAKCKVQDCPETKALKS
jgi:Fur family ferric uptake transcriptional regulator